MKWKECILIALMSFGFGIIAGYFLHGYPTLESALNWIVGGLSFAVVIEVVGIFRELFRERREERAKEVERKNEKYRISKLLLSEIDDIQNEFKTLSNCRNKVFNEYDNILEEDTLPDELNFDNTIYSNMGDKLELLDINCQIKLSQYYKRIETIKEQYKKFEVIRGNSPVFVTLIEFDDKIGQGGSPSSDEIYKFLESTERVYKLGEEIMGRVPDLLNGHSEH